MTKRNLPALTVTAAPKGVDFDVAPSVLARWNSGIRAAEDDTSISIYDYIGGYDGITAGRIAGALRRIGPKDVTVNVNSPGGDVFEGMAIYNLLRDHPGNVTVRVLGLAASAASLIAMAGDTVEIGRAGFLMIHNAWTFSAGNRHDLRAVADMLEPIDAALAGVYAQRTGMDSAAVGVLMDNETWINGDGAVEQGFADALLPADQESAATNAAAPGRTAAQARLEIQAALAKAGYTRARTREVLKEFSGALGGDTPRAADPMPGAGDSGAPVMPGADAAAPCDLLPLNNQGNTMTLEELKAKYPELVKALQEESITIGATAERARIQAVEAQALPGHEALIAQFKFDGKTSGAEAAVAVLAAERAANKVTAAALNADAPRPAPHATAPAPKPAAGEDANLPLEQRCKAKWDTTPSLRAEFGDDYTAFLAFERASANGQVRILKGKAA